MPSSLDVQHGGAHYKGLAIQPIQLSMANRYDACIHSAVKYVSRHRTKGGKEDLMKARHFCELRVDTWLNGQPEALELVSISEYIARNGIPDREGRIIRNLHSWAAGKFRNQSMSFVCNSITTGIDALIATTYPDQKD